MFVPCPHCGFLPALIATPGGGAQRCPRCEGALPAEGAAATPPAPAALPVAGSTLDADATDAMGEVDDAAPDPIATLIASESAAAAASGQAAAPRAAAMAPPARRRAGKPGTPSFVRASHAAVPLGPRWRGLLVIAALLLVLATQLVLVQRDTLAANAQWRPLIARVCAALQCPLPAWHEPSAITMLDRGVHPHPGRPDVLAVQASFRNDARWPQPWPTLLLSLADVDGRPVAQGAFTPREYGLPADAPALLAPGQAASIRFAVHEPEPHSVAFVFEFR